VWRIHLDPKRRLAHIFMCKMRQLEPQNRHVSGSKLFWKMRDPDLDFEDGFTILKLKVQNSSHILLTVYFSIILQALCITSLPGTVLYYSGFLV
jgi:hypothetical protein